MKMPRRSIAIVLGLVVLAVAVRLALPYVARAVLEDQLAKALGRPVAIERVELALTRGSAAIEGFAAGEPELRLLVFSRLFVNLHFFELLRGEVRLESVEIADPEIAVRLRSDGTLEPILLPTEASEEAPEPTAETAELPEIEEPGSGWPVHVDQLEVGDLALYVASTEAGSQRPAELSLGRLSLRDLGFVDGHLDFGSIGIERPRIRVRRDLAIAPADPEQAAPSPSADPDPDPELDAEPSGEGIEISGSDLAIEGAELAVQLGEEEVTFLVDVAMKEVTFASGQRFPVELRLEREGGWLRFEGEAGVQPVALQGDVELEGLSLAKLLRLADPESAAQIDNGVLGGKLALDVGLEAEGLRMALDGALDVAELAAQSEGRHIVSTATRLRLSDVRTTPRESGESAIRAAGLVLELDGLGLRDETVEPVVLIEMSELRANAAALRWPERDLELDASFATFGAASGTATSRLAAGKGRTELAIDSLALGSFSGYARQSGFLVKAGRASLGGGVDSEATRHDGNFDLDVENLEVETIDAGAFEKYFGMSPDLAFAVLQDPTGGVSLPLHFEIDTASGETGISVARLMQGAMRQALTGIVSAPLKGLGFVAKGVLGERGGLEIEPVAFVPGKDDWAEGQGDYVGAIARMLIARPAVAARITGGAGEDESFRPERLAEKRAKKVSEALLEAGVDPAALALAPPQLGEPGVAFEFFPRTELEPPSEG